MKKLKFNLSEKIGLTYDGYVAEEYLKEFIKLLKKEFRKDEVYLGLIERTERKINKLAGDKII